MRARVFASATVIVRDPPNHTSSLRVKVAMCNQRQVDSPLYGSMALLAQCLIWWCASIKKYGYTWHRMSLLRPGVIKQHKTGTQLCSACQVYNLFFWYWSIDYRAVDWWMTGGLISSFYHQVELSTLCHLQLFIICVCWVSNDVWVLKSMS